MTDITVEAPKPISRFQPLRLPILLALTLLALVLVLNLLSNLGGLALDDEVLLESTLGRLATWMAQQTGNDPEEILSPWAIYAKNWAKELGAEKLDPDILYTSMRNLRIAYYGLIVLLLVYTVMAVVVRPRRAPALLFVILLLLNALLFLIPSLEGSNALTLARLCHSGGARGDGSFAWQDQPRGRLLSGAVFPFGWLGSQQSDR